MDWQKVYKGNACRMADYLSSLLDGKVKPEEYMSDGPAKYGPEWTEREETEWAWRELQRKMNYLDATTKEIPF